MERFFRDLTVSRIRRGVFRIVADLTTAIEEHLTSHNASPMPFA